jgi:hypothetical protein
MTERNPLPDCLSHLAQRDAKWLPIETSPKDGTFVLCALRYGHVTILQFCSEGHWRSGVFSDARQVPTHWMPLPEPPA